MLPHDLPYTDFLYWLKEHTENHWNQDPNLTLGEGQRTCEQWACGAKWIGMTDDQIDGVQARYSIRFTPEHREFLRIMHAVDRKARYYEYYGEEEGKCYEQSLFRNWLEDHDEIESRLTFPYDCMVEDTLAGKGVWLKSWGPEPETPEERLRIFHENWAVGPPLVPILGHRYQVADLTLEQRPVLSIIGFDVVWYGNNFRQYLLHELNRHLDIYEPVFNEIERIWYPEVREEYKVLFEPYDKHKLPDIPFWTKLAQFDLFDHSQNDHL